MVPGECDERLLVRERSKDRQFHAPGSSRMRDEGAYILVASLFGGTEARSKVWGREYGVGESIPCSVLGFLLVAVLELGCYKLL